MIGNNCNQLENPPKEQKEWYTHILGEVMEVAFWYFLIGLLTSVIGAISGLGGGVFIKPILDFFGHYPITTIGVLSSTSVFTMSAVSLWTRRRELKTMDRVQTALLA